MKISLPDGSEVDLSTACTLRYIDRTNQTVAEVHGQIMDSRTVETITPGKLQVFVTTSYYIDL